MENTTENDKGTVATYAKSNDSFISNTLKLTGGTTIVQILLVFASPIITRLYGPEAYGLAAIFASIIGIIGSIACLRYDYAIVLPRKDEEAASLLGLCLLLAIIISLIIIPIIWLVNQYALVSIMASKLMPYIWFIPLSILLNGWLLALTGWNSRKKQFGRLSIARMTGSIATIFIQLVAGFLGYASGGSLIISSIIGSTIIILMQCSQILLNERSFLRESINIEWMAKGIKRYKKFPLIDTLSTLINVTSWRLPALLLAFFFSPTVAGYYALAFTLIQLPMSLIGGAIAQVFFQRASDAKVEGNLHNIVENVFRFLVIISMFPMLTLTIIGNDIFTVFFGDRWAEAGVYTQILSIWAILWFISAPLGSLILVLEKQEFQFKVGIANFVTRLIAICIGGLLGNARISILLFAILGLFVYTYFLLGIIDMVGVSRKSIVDSLKSNFILFIPTGIILIIMSILSVSPLIKVFVSVILFFIYVVYIIKNNNIINGLVYDNIYLKLNGLFTN